LAKHRVELTPQEEDIFKRTLKTGNLDIFTEHFFRLEWSGTWFTPEDRVEQYDALYSIWSALGKPDGRFGAKLDGVPTEFKIMWDPYYGGYPMILLPHGFRSLPWVKEFVSPSITKGLAITGTGSGKTSGLAIAALSYCALFPGFGFRNVAQRQATSMLMLKEVVKWVKGSAFERFIVPTRASNSMWKERPYPTISVDAHGSGIESTFACQTLGRVSGASQVSAQGILGEEEDFISVEEAQLVENIRDVNNVLLTRLRGTRANGVPRSTMLRWITNPGGNTELGILMEEYRELRDGGDTGVLVLEGLNSSANIYITKKQLKEQVKAMSRQDQDRWLGGEMSAVLYNNEFGEELLEICKDDELDRRVVQIGKMHDAVGLSFYELPFEPDRNYVIAADFGKSHLVGLHSVNVPCVMVYDITDFLKRPTKLVAFYWVSGEGTYNVFMDLCKRAMLRYKCVCYYDATTVQTMPEDLDQAWSAMPTHPIFFSGEPGRKAWALAVLVQLLSDKQFAIPYIKGLWHQSRIYQVGGRKKADDIIATMLVFALALRYQGNLWDLFVRAYNWEELRDGDQYKKPLAQPMDTFGRLPI
jgi:hypothetical protein